ncbi:hypothetical protein PRUPE_1G142200 [Prunus persica]|uniref:Uncharacterized protein n=1 Tax=Prunus persica TaxID=3760 RepID=A0A251QX72_PRUPE|nr:hypothetical protein PRUPE_1G142200 [Prunus persica]ONI28430.1 hypothetical protein PRUPE_1G142200 [Prunus persica]
MVGGHLDPGPMVEETAKAKVWKLGECGSRRSKSVGGGGQPASYRLNWMRWVAGQTIHCLVG